MKILIGTQANSRGEIVYLGHGPSEAAARRCFREWLNKGLNPNDEEAAGARLLDSSKCTERLFAALTAPQAEGATADAIHVFNWASGSLYFNESGLLDARYVCREEFDVANPHLARNPQPAPTVDAQWDGEDGYVYD